MNVYPENNKREKYFFRILPRDRLREFGDRDIIEGHGDCDLFACIVDASGERTIEGNLFEIKDGCIKIFPNVNERAAKIAGIQLDKNHSINVKIFGNI